MNQLILLPILVPMIAGILMGVSYMKDFGDPDVVRHTDFEIHLLSGPIMTISAVMAVVLAWTTEGEVTLFHLVADVPVYFKVDDLSRWFVTFTSIVFVIGCYYSFEYMVHEGHQKRYFACYMLTYGVLVALDFSGNLVTMYLCYELMTLASVPLVMHSGKKVAVMAGLKYLFYSMCGAYLALLCIFFLYRYAGSLTFVPGGGLLLESAAADKDLLLVIIFLAIIGFGTKAGMFPMQAWLPTAHPVAPAPASAVLSAVIVKSGVLAIIRVLFYIVGPEFIRGTWVQYAWMGLTMLTIFMGSMLAFREKVFKKRLAYSTVSQVSYILFGLSLLDPMAFSGALLHVMFHSFIKAALFMSAGIFIFRTEKHDVDEYGGIGRKYPKTLWVYTIAALGLIGIPPTGGFVSKWYLAGGALKSTAGPQALAGVGVLLLSALLTAGYLLPITTSGFFVSGKEGEVDYPREKWDEMSMTLLILTSLVVLGGVFPGPLYEFAYGIASKLF